MRSRLLLVLTVMLLALVLPTAAVASRGGQLGWSPSLSSFASASSVARAAGARPVITRFSLSAAKPGARLTISGRGFGARRGKGSVLFGVFKSTSYVRWSATRIVCKVPVIPAAKLTIKVRTAKRTSNGKRFTVRPLPTVIPKTTDVLNAATVGGATTADGSTYSFANTSQTSSLKPGDVIVGEPTAALPAGIFRKVTAVAAGGGSVTTTPATLEDAFTSAQFSADHPITQSDATSAAIAPGVRLVRSRAQRPDLLTFRLVDVGISSSLSADFGPVSVSGTITLKTTVHVGGAIDLGGVKSFETSETTTVSSDLRAAVSLTQPFKEEKTLAKWGAGQISGFTVMVPPVPLYFQPELSIVVGVSGELSAGIQTSVHEEVSGGIGLTYQSGKFTPWTKFTTGSSYEPPTLYGSCSAKVYAGAQLGLKLYDAAGPYIKLDGFAKLAADTSKTPSWKLSAGVEASMGAEAGGDYGFIHWKLDWHTDAFIIKEWPLAQAKTPAPSPGTIAGLIEDTNGNALDSVDVAVSNGATTFASTVSSSDGTYAMDVPVGSDYTVTFSKDGYASDSRGGISVSEGETTTLDPVTLAALPSPGETRIVLTWGQDPADLDSHLVGPYADGSLFHVFFRQPGDSSYAELDYDCTTSFGPETIALYSQIDGTYSYAVHDYTNRDSTESSSLSQSGATVRVYRGDTLAAAFSVPAGVSGTLWTVFTMDGNVITPVNTMSYESDPYAVLMPASAAILSTSSDSKQK